MVRTRGPRGLRDPFGVEAQFEDQDLGLYHRRDAGFTPVST